MITSLAAQWILAAYLGGATTAPASVSVRTNDGPTRINSISFESRSWQNPLYYGIRGGYRFRRGLGFEGELIHLKAFANVSPEHGVLLPQFNMSHGANLLFGNIVAYHAVGSAKKFRLTGRAGAGVSLPHVEARIADVRVEGYELGGAAFQIAGGPELRLGRGFALLTEYKFTHGAFDIGSSAVGAKTELATHHGVVGLMWEIPR